MYSASVLNNTHEKITKDFYHKLHDIQYQQYVWEEEHYVGRMWIQFNCFLVDEALVSILSTYWCSRPLYLVVCIAAVVVEWDPL